MHFQIIKDKFYNNILKELDDKVPEFKSVFTKEDGVYPILGDLGNYIIQNIHNENIMKKISQFINYAIKVGGNETEDVIVLQIFQPIYDDEHLVSKVKAWLQGKALRVFLAFEDKYKQNNYKK